MHAGVVVSEENVLSVSDGCWLVIAVNELVEPGNQHEDDGIDGDVANEK